MCTGSSCLWLLCPISAICGHRLDAIKVIPGVTWALQGKCSSVLGGRLQVKGPLIKPTLQWRKHKYSFSMVTPIPQEDRKKFSEKRIGKEEGGRSVRSRGEKVRKQLWWKQPLVGFQSLVLWGRVTHCLLLSKVKFRYGLDQLGNL